MNLWSYVLFCHHISVTHLHSQLGDFVDHVLQTEKESGWGMQPPDNLSLRHLPYSRVSPLFPGFSHRGRRSTIQCVPIKRKTVLSVRYVNCHARFNQTICFIIKGIFSSFIWYQTHDNISMYDWKGIIWTHAGQNRFAQNNGVELIWRSSD